MVLLRLMTNFQLAIFGVSAGLLNLLAEIPAVRAIFAGTNKPERGTWWMWFILSFISLFGQIAGGAHWSAILSFTSTIVGGLIAVLSIKYGYGRFHFRDGLGITIAIIGGVYSLIVHDPLIAVVVVTLIEIIAAGLTVYKTWYAPFTENFLSWRISLIGTMCGVLAVGQYRPVIYLPPLTNFIINLTMVTLITSRRPKVKTQPLDL
ncbi:hypothetical protein KW794_02925 [Candidatus Saccharibacteria bacterium]|nr:hypothetical protein [Candidatus Saccharibacteria bacterium]